MFPNLNQENFCRSCARDIEFSRGPLGGYSAQTRAVAVQPIGWKIHAGFIPIPLIDELGNTKVHQRHPVTWWKMHRGAEATGEHDVVVVAWNWKMWSSRDAERCKVKGVVALSPAIPSYIHSHSSVQSLRFLLSRTALVVTTFCSLVGFAACLDEICDGKPCCTPYDRGNSSRYRALHHGCTRVVVTYPGMVLWLGK